MVLSFVDKPFFKKMFSFETKRSSFKMTFKPLMHLRSWPLIAAMKLSKRFSGLSQRFVRIPDQLHQESSLIVR